MDSALLTEHDLTALTERKITLPINSMALRDYLPHRYPFLLLDRVTACRPDEWLTAIKNVSINEPFFNGHFPEEPIMPGVLMVEALAQASGVLQFISKNMKPKDGILYLFAGVDKVRFRRLVIPGDQLVLRTQKTMARSGVYKFAASAEVAGELAVSAEIILSEQHRQYGKD
ncbi:(3R)-hydroxymyristoyl-ACP dehydratase [Moraxella macacae 0408225]|uniref:3-hydroxyacyl-[acyl-carrier-protein] dehydratase FabZ n=1 Tax=Moraxella macacae 0408225 TaxID=1230338 RepID=L2F688_9GAMM|nr:3-hydroxyacyl-ACP dehydratase FabZ [Moraxella macacae]ELA08306.1 (3R)-hydroxymyristoyl-ACP dehydratase [Moraxella macacae 0408225]